MPTKRDKTINIFVAVILMLSLFLTILLGTLHFGGARNGAISKFLNGTKFNEFVISSSKDSINDFINDSDLSSDHNLNNLNPTVIMKKTDDIIDNFKSQLVGLYSEFLNNIKDKLSSTIHDSIPLPYDNELFKYLSKAFANILDEYTDQNENLKLIKDLLNEDGLNQRIKPIVESIKSEKNKFINELSEEIFKQISKLINHAEEAISKAITGFMDKLSGLTLTLFLISLVISILLIILLIINQKSYIVLSLRNLSISLFISGGLSLLIGLFMKNSLIKKGISSASSAFKNSYIYLTDFTHDFFNELFNPVIWFGAILLVGGILSLFMSLHLKQKKWLPS